MHLSGNVARRSSSLGYIMCSENTKTTPARKPHEDRALCSRIWFPSHSNVYFEGTKFFLASFHSRPCNYKYLRFRLHHEMFTLATSKQKRRVREWDEPMMPREVKQLERAAIWVWSESLKVLLAINWWVTTRAGWINGASLWAAHNALCTRKSRVKRSARSRAPNLFCFLLLASPQTRKQKKWKRGEFINKTFYWRLVVSRTASD
jgi:hypothetical protein